MQSGSIEIGSFLVGWALGTLTVAIVFVCTSVVDQAKFRALSPQQHVAIQEAGR